MITIAILNFCQASNGCFPNGLIALRILLTLPGSVSSAERCFSKWKLIKSYLRPTMSQARLSGLAMLSIEHGLVKELDYKKLIGEFASKKASRLV